VQYSQNRFDEWSLTQNTNLQPVPTLNVIAARVPPIASGLVDDLGSTPRAHGWFLA
jgi:hypothetical protein